MLSKEEIEDDEMIINLLYQKIDLLEDEIGQLKNKDFEDLCNECSTIVKESGLTEEDIDKIVAETREIQRKADKYDLLVEEM